MVEGLATGRKWYALVVCISMVAKLNGFIFEVLYIVIRSKHTKLGFQRVCLAVYWLSLDTVNISMRREEMIVLCIKLSKKIEKQCYKNSRRLRWLIITCLTRMES